MASPPVSCVSTRNGFPYSESSHPHRPAARGGGRVNGDWPWIAVPGVKHDLIECQVRSRTDGLLPTISPGYPFRRSPLSASRRNGVSQKPWPPRLRFGEGARRCRPESAQGDVYKAVGVLV